MGMVIEQAEIRILEIENRFDIGIDLERWQRLRFARELQFRLIQVVTVQMSIAERMHELARLQASDLRDHHR